MNKVKTNIATKEKPSENGQNEPNSKLKKLIILDTSSVLIDPVNIVHAFDNNDVFLTHTLITEIDKLKSSEINNVGFNAREFLRELDRIKELADKATFHNGYMEYYLPSKKRSILIGDIDYTLKSKNNANSIFQGKMNDHAFINIATKAVSKYKNKPNAHKNYSDVVIISQDMGLRVKANSLNIKAERYESINVSETPKGISTLKINNHQETWKAFESKHSLTIKEMGIKSEEVSMNTFYKINLGDDTEKTIFIDCEKKVNVIEGSYSMPEGVPQKNEEQLYACYLVERDIPIIALEGGGGTSKTFSALLCGISGVLKGKYSKILYFSSARTVGSIDRGAMPGDLKEKTEFYFGPLYYNLNKIIEIIQGFDKQLADKINTKIRRLIHPMVIDYSRGETYENAFVIFDEAQNTNRLEMKTFLSRIGVNSKVVILGDTDQIDVPSLDRRNNGLSYIISCLKKIREFGYLGMTKVVRGLIAKIANDLLK